MRGREIPGEASRGNPPRPRSPPRETRLEVFAISPPGFEDLVAAELRSLGAPDAAVVVGGAVFHGGWPDVYRANLLCRVASRILVRVGRFRAETFGALEQGLVGLEWPRWVTPGRAVELRVAKRRTRLYHTGKVAEITRGVLSSAAGSEPSTPGGSAQRFYVRIDGPEATVSVDTSGDHLHRRGYRPEPGPAPIRENVAAGLLLRAGWDGTEPFLDPLCGAGTFALEAALTAVRAPAGAGRGFAFEALPEFDSAVWSEIKARAEAEKLPGLRRPVFASDRDPEAVGRTARSARRAGLGDQLRVAVADLGELEPPAARGLLVTNPPWGRRLRGRRDAYAAIGTALAGAFRRWRWGIVVPGRTPPQGFGMTPADVRPFRSGGLRCAFALGGPAGSGSGDGPSGEKRDST